MSENQRGIAVLCIMVFIVGAYVGAKAGDYMNPANVLVNSIYDEDSIEYLNVVKMTHHLKKDNSDRLGFIVFTQKGIYTAPNLDQNYELVAGIRRKSDKKVVMRNWND